MRMRRCRPRADSCVVGKNTKNSKNTKGNGADRVANKDW